MSHTPAPWTIADGVSNRVFLVNDDKGNAIGEIVYTDTRRRADALLIAAAPDLLAVLRAVADDGIAMQGFHEQFRTTIRAAIAKATGENA